jgi:hypothetical protein
MCQQAHPQLHHAGGTPPTLCAPRAHLACLPHAHTQLPEMLQVLTEAGAAECWHKKSDFRVRGWQGIACVCVCCWGAPQGHAVHADTLCCHACACLLEGRMVRAPTSCRCRTCLRGPGPADAQSHLLEVYKIVKLWGADEATARCALFHRCACVRVCVRACVCVCVSVSSAHHCMCHARAHRRATPGGACRPALQCLLQLVCEPGHLQAGCGAQPGRGHHRRRGGAADAPVLRGGSRCRRQQACACGALPARVLASSVVGVETATRHPCCIQTQTQTQPHLVLLLDNRCRGSSSSRWSCWTSCPWARTTCRCRPAA